MNNFLQKYIVHTLLVGAALLCMGSSLWSPGAIVLLDYVLTPYAPVRGFSALNFIMLDGLSGIFGPEIVSKLFFLAILLAAAYLGMLFARLMARKYHFTHIRTLEFFGGLFFILNPFAYERMMVQPTIYLGIIFIGYLAYALFAHEGYKKWILAGIFSGLAFNMFLHASFMIALVFLLYIAFFVRKKSDIMGILLAGGIAFLINANWLLASLFGVQNSTSSIETFNIANFQAFLTQSLAPMNVWFTNIFLYGFWGERFSNHYANVDFLSKLWYVAGFALLLVMGLGKWLLWTQKETKNGRNVLYFFGFLGIFSLIFGIGIASPMTEWLTLWMAEHIPFWQGYREPQKWIGILMIVEVVFLLLGIGFLLKKYGKDIVVRVSIIISVLLLLLTWSPGPLLGYHGQLKNTVYPQEFSALRSELLSQNFDEKILVFPWHSYIGCSWMGRPTVSNPISGLMSPLAITSANNIEVSGILYSNYSDPETVAIENFIKNHDTAEIYAHNYAHILLMKQCASSDTFTWLDTMPDCQKIEDNSILSFYQCQKNPQ